MFLASTSDILRIVTGQAVSTIGVQAAWVDFASGTATPGRTNTNITTATTTTVVGSPAASTVRNVTSLMVENKHATSSCVVTIQHFDGTTSVDIEKITLLAGEQFNLLDSGEIVHKNSTGGEYTSESNINPSRWGFEISGHLGETLPRHLSPDTNLAMLATGEIYVTALYLKKGTIVTNISFSSGLTAAGTPTNQIFGLYSDKRARLAVTNNDTTTAWAADTIKTLALTAPYTITKSGIYYLAILVTATTVPTLRGIVAPTVLGATQIYGQSLQGRGTPTGLTTVLPDPVTILTTAGVGRPWASVS